MIICLLFIIVADKRPNVDCSFITEFEDHIFVTVDAELFFFLHDLITSYLREKEKVRELFWCISYVVLKTMTVVEYKDCFQDFFYILKKGLVKRLKHVRNTLKLFFNQYLLLKVLEVTFLLL